MMHSQKNIKLRSFICKYSYYFVLSSFSHFKDEQAQI